MIRAFAFLTFRSQFNRFRYQLRRLREPRYLFSAVAAIAYFYLMFGRRGRPSVRIPPQFDALTFDLVAIAALAVLILAWAIPNHAALEFSEAEIQFLFTGPVSRRKLLLYKLFRTQPAVLATTAVLTVLQVPNGYVIGLWVVWTTLSIYFTFIQLARARMRMIGIQGWMIGAVALAAFGACAWALNHFSAEVGTSMPNVSPFDPPVTRALLFVPGVFPGALFTRGFPQVALCSGILLACAALLFYAAGSLRVPFEELAASASEVQSIRRVRVRGRAQGQSVLVRRFPPLFRLRSGAAPEAAVVWKNVIAATRIASPWLLFIAVIYGLCLGAALFTSEPNVVGMCFGISIFVVVYFPLAGSMAFQQDLRLDFRNFDILKSWPLSGERLVAAAIGAPLAIMSILEMGFVVGTFVIAQRMEKPPFAAAPEFVVIALLFAIPVCATQLVIRNALLVMFPAWAGRSKDEQRGFVAMGQRLLSVLFNFLVLFALLVPAAALSGAGYWAATRVTAGPAVLALATMPGVGVLVAEVLMLVRALGGRFDRLDVASEMSPG